MQPSFYVLRTTTLALSLLEPAGMAHSLSDACTPLKHEYDACFNAWFEGYLEPAVAASEGTPEQRAAYSQAKAAEYEKSCGPIWTQYKDCVQVSINKEGLQIAHH